jgi:cell wall-associated NlpC family hydrolase
MAFGFVNLAPRAGLNPPYQAPAPAPKPAPKPAAKPAVSPMGGPAAPSPGLLQLLSPAQLNAETNAQLAAQMQAQQAPILAAQQASDVQARAAQEALKGFSLAAAQILGGMGPDAQAAYQNAAQESGALGQGVSQGMQQRAAAAQQAANDLIGQLAPGGSMVNPPSPTSGADAVYASGFEYPGQSLAAQGAAQRAYVDSLPGVETATGQQQLLQAIHDQAQTDAGFKQQLLQLAASAPALRDQLYNTLLGQQMDTAKFQEQLQNDQFNQGLDVAKLQQSAASQKSLSQYRTAETALAAQRVSLDASKFAQQTLQSNRSYALSLQKLGLQTKALQLKATEQQYKLQNGGFTPNELNKFQTDAAFVASEAATAKSKPSYATAMQEMMQRNVPPSIAMAALEPLYPNQAVPNQTGITSVPTTYAGNKAGKSTTVYTGTGPNGQTVNVNVPPNITPAMKSVVQNAIEYLGTPYAYGGESPTGFDCSGLAQYIYAKAGVSIPRTSQQQYAGGMPVSKAQLQPGDLVFYVGSDGTKTAPGHVGIYVGNNQMIVAPHTGASVEVESINQGGYVGARRYTS